MSTMTETGRAEAREAETDQAAPTEPSGELEGGKFLTFSLGEEEYGIEILKVREIIGMMPITSVPRTPDYVEGVLNLRGQVIPVIDLRRKFEMPAVEPSDETCIIVVQSGGVRMGAIVDSVDEVLDIPTDDLTDAPALGADVNTDHLLGIGKTEESVKLLLDIDRILADVDELDVDEETAEA